MAYLARALKEDLVRLGTEMGIELNNKMKVIEIKTCITKDKNYDEEFCKELLCTIINDRKEQEEERRRKEDMEFQERKRKEDMEFQERKRREDMEFQERKLKEDREFELQKLNLPNVLLQSSSNQSCFKSKIDLSSLVQKFDPVNNDISLYLVLFERQAQTAEIPKEFWATHLISLLPYEIAQLIVREEKEIAEDYDKVKNLLLKRYKLTPEKFRQLFCNHVKTTEKTWKDFAYELKNFFRGWISGLEIATFEELCELMITDQIKRRVPPDVREHFVDEWPNIKIVENLVLKLDDYESVRSDKKKFEIPFSRKFKPPKMCAEPPKFFQNQKFQHGGKINDVRPQRTLACYGCGRPGVIKAKCPFCSPSNKTDDFCANAIQMYTCHSSSSPIALLDINIMGIKGRVCADTGASRSVVGEIMYNLLRERGVDFKKTSIQMTLADGCQSTKDARTAMVTVEIKGKMVPIEILALPEAKGNRTLLGTDFLEKSGIVLDVKNKLWYFDDSPCHTVSFKEDLDVRNLQKVFHISVNNVDLRVNEGEDLIEQNES